ncbi:MAG: hypothetical protein ACQESP_02900 [Candidatus Muiribacteriota bacterium]
MNNLNKKGFTVYYVVFFIIIIMMFSFVYISRVSHSTRNLVRDFENFRARELCDSGIAAAKNLIYKNYAQTNYDFYENLNYPVEFVFSTGVVRIESIEYLKNIKYDENEYNLDFKNLDYFSKGAKVGVYDVLEVVIEAETASRQTMKANSLIKAVRVENP